MPNTAQPNVEFESKVGPLTHLRRGLSDHGVNRLALSVAALGRVRKSADAAAAAPSRAQRLRV